MADTERTFSLLGLIIELGGCPNNPCVIVADCGIPLAERTRLLNAASMIFKRAVLVPTTHKLPDESWPRGANWLFQTACHYFKHVAGTPFLWLEPDCVPMQIGWIEKIEVEYFNRNKPFMGANVNNRHLSGISVYPSTAYDDYQMFFKHGVSDRAWDYAVDARPFAAITSKIEHFWGLDGLPPHFVKRKKKTDPIHYRLASSISPETEVFHRDKDASLTRIVIEEQFNNKVDVAILMLGRYGDICNVLPIAQEIYRSTESPALFVYSSEFEDLMHGVTYVDKLPLDIPYLERAKAVQFLNGKCHTLLIPQVCGTGYDNQHRCESFTKEQWRLCGFLDRFYDKSLKLTFDNRDRFRESQLLDRLPLIQKPTLLMSLASGKSSPFTSGQLLKTQIVNNLTEWHCIDLDSIKAEKPFDLLGLYESATVLITTDTMHVHLAAACNIPVILLTGDIPWLRSVSRANVVATFYYSEAIHRTVEILQVIRDVAPSHPLRRTPRNRQPVRA